MDCRRNEGLPALTCAHLGLDDMSAAGQHSLPALCFLTLSLTAACKACALKHPSPGMSASSSYPPPPQQLHQDVPPIALEQQLADEVEVGDQCALKDDRHVAGVEQLDGVLLLQAAPLLAAHGQVHAEALDAQRGQMWQASPVIDAGEHVAWKT